MGTGIHVNIRSTKRGDRRTLPKIAVKVDVRVLDYISDRCGNVKNVFGADILRGSAIGSEADPLGGFTAGSNSAGEDC